MKKAVFAIFFLLSGCVENSDAFMTGFVSGMLGTDIPIGTAYGSGAYGGGAYGGGSFGGGAYGGAANGGDANQIPNTAQCRQYLQYMSTSGPMATLKPLIDLYHDCLNSAPNSAMSVAYRCGPGKYYWYFGGSQGCGRL